jgi:hypothetical protein
MNVPKKTTLTNLPFQTSTTIIAGKFNILLYIKLIQDLRNIGAVYYIFSGHLRRLLTTYT